MARSNPSGHFHLRCYLALMKIPRSNENDYTVEIAKKRRDFVENVTGQELAHTGSYSGSPKVYAGNTEHFMGVAQVLWD